MSIDRDRYNRIRKVQAEMGEFSHLIDSLGFNDLDACYDVIDAILERMPIFAAVLEEFKRSEYYVNRDKFRNFVNANFHPRDYSDNYTSFERKLNEASTMLNHIKRLEPKD